MAFNTGIFLALFLIQNLSCSKWGNFYRNMTNYAFCYTLHIQQDHCAVLVGKAAPCSSSVQDVKMQSDVSRDAQMCLILILATY